MKRFGLLAICLMLLGCSSVPIASEQAAETTRVVQSELLRASPDRPNQVVVVLDDVFGPSVIKPTIYMDGQELGSLSQGEKITFYVATGIHQFGWSALTKGNYREQEFQVSPDMRNNFHLSTPGGDVVRFVREHGAP